MGVYLEMSHFKSHPQYYNKYWILCLIYTMCINNLITVCKTTENILFQVIVKATISSNSSILNNEIFQPLEGFHHLAEQTFQVEDFLHQEAFHSRLLSAGGVNALSRLPPNQDLVLEFWTSRTKRAGETDARLVHVKHMRSHSNYRGEAW